MPTGGLTIVAIDAAEETARDRLQAKDVDVVVVAPEDAQATLERGDQAVLRVEYDSIDPYIGLLVDNAADRIASAVNRELIRRAAERGAEGGERRRFAAPGTLRAGPGGRADPGGGPATSHRRHRPSPGSTASPCWR